MSGNLISLWTQRCALSPVRRILALTGLIDVFSVSASVEDAVRIARPVVTVG